MRTLAFAAALALQAPALAQEAGTGRIVVSLGVCNGAYVDLPVLLFKEVSAKHHFRASPPAFSKFDYTDDVGGYSVIVRDLPAGQWVLYNHEMYSRYIGERRRHFSRNDYVHRFTVEPGKVVDLGRFCAASQATGEKYPDMKELANTKVLLAYFVVGPSRDEDVQRARKAESAGVLLEVVSARPAPEVVSRLFRARFVEPRTIATPAPERPQEFPR